MIKSETGSGTITSVGILGVILITFLLSISLGKCLFLKVDAKNVANQSALYGAHMAQLGFDGCSFAKDVAIKNNYSLSGCKFLNNDIQVVVAVHALINFSVQSKAGESDLPCFVK